MKSIAICLVLIACLESRAQDFRCIPQEGFYFDAKKILNVDSELQHVFIERIDSLFNIKIGYFNTVLDDVNNDGCYFPNSPNLVSQPVVFYGDSITQFHSNGGIEIRIKNLAKKGDSWVMSRLTGGSTIRAKISDVYLSNVYGEVDVIKKISLVTLDSLGDTILTPLNNLFFELSQHHGLVKIPDINSYPNGGYMALYTDCQQKTLSNKEVYDYDIGDEFHYNMYYGDDWTNEVIYMTRKVLNRLDFPNEEMIVYTILEKKLIDQTDHNHNQDPVWKYPFRIEENEVQDTIRDLNEAAIDVFIDRYKKYNQGKTIMDKIIYTSSDSSYLEYLRAFKNTFNLPANVFSGSAYYKYGNCFRPSTFEFTPSFYKVYKGL
ncbi:MAG: hypothetical protein KDC83_11200, partial [Flavobacteriales bacterium]|nr:hypothetical protein [Flavobacteriales bacterium]